RVRWNRDRASRESRDRGWQVSGPRRRSCCRSCDRSLSALDPQVDLHPLLVLLQNAVILAQGVAFPAVGQKDALQIGMSVELNSEHVINFALQPVGGRPDRDARRDGSAVGDLRLHAYPLIARERIEYPYDVELLLAFRIMRCGNIDTVIELLFVAQQAQDVGDQRAVDGKVVLAQISLRVEPRAVLAAVFFNQGRGPRQRNGTSWLGGSRRLRRRGRSSR